MCGITKTINDFNWKVLNKRLSNECGSCAMDRDNTRYSSSIHSFIKMLIKIKYLIVKEVEEGNLSNLDFESF